MSRPISEKCQECSKLRFVKKNNKYINAPECWEVYRCSRKRGHYKNLEENRKRMRSRHKYIKYCSTQCALCQSKDNLEVHHIKPQVFGVDNSRFNTITLCHNCHLTISKYYTIIGIQRKKYK